MPVLDYGQNVDSCDLPVTPKNQTTDKPAPFDPLFRTSPSAELKKQRMPMDPLLPAAACFCLISFFVPTCRIPDPQSLLKLLKVRIQLQLKCFHQNPSSRQKTATKDFDSSKAMSSCLPQKPGNQCFTSESFVGLQI